MTSITLEAASRIAALARECGKEFAFLVLEALEEQHDDITDDDVISMLKGIVGLADGQAQRREGAGDALRANGPADI